jgi:hypothetical protein
MKMLKHKIYSVSLIFTKSGSLLTFLNEQNVAPTKRGTHAQEVACARYRFKTVVQKEDANSLLVLCESAFCSAFLKST